MTRMIRLTGLAASAMIAGGVVGGAVHAADLPVQTKHASARTDHTYPAPASTHSCVDINGRTFAWSWSNVPFASICDAGPDKQ